MGDSRGLVKASWPFGKITLFGDRLVLNAGFKSFELMYADIDYVKFRYIQLQIEHGNPSVPEHVDVNGFLIPSQIKKAIQAHGLPIEVR